MSSVAAGTRAGSLRGGVAASTAPSVALRSWYRCSLPWRRCGRSAGNRGGCSRDVITLVALPSPLPSSVYSTSASAQSGEPAGGALGSAVATLAFRILGPFGAGLALFAAGVLAIFLLAGSDFQTFCDDVRALLEATWRAITILVAVLASIEARIRRFGVSLRSRTMQMPRPIQPPLYAIYRSAARPKASQARPAALSTQTPDEVAPPVINVPARTSPSSRLQVRAGRMCRRPFQTRLLDHCRFPISRKWPITMTWRLIPRTCTPRPG